MHITLKDLTALELEWLEFNIKTVRYNANEVEFIHNNLYRDKSGVAYYLVKGSDRPHKLYTR